MWWLAACVVFALAAGWHWRGRRLAALHARLGSGLTALPGLGHTYLFLSTDNHKVMSSIIKLTDDALDRGGLSSYWLMDRLLINIVDLEVACFILRTCHEKGDALRVIRELYGDCSVFATADVWRPRKKQFLSPMMTPKNVNALFDTFVKHMDVMLQRLRRRGLHDGRGVVCAFEYFMTNSLDNTSEATFGVSHKSQLESHCSVIEALDDIMRIGGLLLLNSWLFYRDLYKITPHFRAYKKSEKVFMGYISESVQKKQDEWKQAEKIETLQTDGLERDSSGSTCLMEVMKRAGVNDSVVLREEALGVLVAGTDTVALSASFIALMLATHQRVQQAVYQELLEIFGTSERLVTPEDLPRMKYLEAVIKETMRLHSPGPVILREANADLALPNGLMVLKGCFIAINIYGVNRNPKYWGEDASEFRPERFMEPLKHPEAYLVFSHGPRGCPGILYTMNLLKINFSTLLRNYRILPAPGTPPEPRLLFYVTLKPENTNILLEPRV